MSAESVSFTVEQTGAPNLAGDGEEAPPPDDVAKPAAADAVGDLWTPEEASALLVGVFNVGVLVYGPEWTGHPSEFRASGVLLAPQLDRFMPKSAGGGLATLGVGLIACTGEFAGATARRWTLLKRGPRPIWAIEQPKGPTTSPTRSPAPAPADAAETPAPAGSGTVRLSRELEHVIESSARPDSSLAGLGL